VADNTTGAGPKSRPEHTVWVFYDLRDPDQWEGARSDREAWGRGLSEVYSLDTDHIVIAFYPGGAEVAA
jgi:hypothetical protein